MVLARPSTASIPATKYFALYWFETADPAAVKQAAASARPRFTTSPAFDAARTRGYTYRAIGPMLLGDEVRAARKKSAR